MSFNTRNRSCAALLVTVLAATVIALPACGSDDGTKGGDAGGDSTTPVLLEDGEWVLGASLAGIGLVLPFAVHIDSTLAADGSGTIDLFELACIGKDADGQPFQSDVLASATAIAVAADGTFKATLPAFTIAAECSTISNPVAVTDWLIEGTVTAPDSICGTIDTTAPLLSMDFAGTTFKAVPEDDLADPMETACEGGTKVYTPIESCPVLIPGGNKLVSAELDRTFDVYLPSGATPTAGWPVVFLFHGLGNSAEQIVDVTGMDTLVSEGGFILIAPEGANNPDGTQVNPGEWTAQAPAFGLDNRDLVFFDDMVGCAAKQWNIDGNRVYAAGMSAGGLFTTFLGVHRAEVLAATAPFSGGYFHAWPDDAVQHPWMVSWGGPDDKWGGDEGGAAGVNFDTLAAQLLGFLGDDGMFTVSCNHGQKHVWPKELTKPAWDFLSAFKRGENADPWGGKLPDSFPSYCKIAD